MQCPRCQHQNNDTAKFCEECGTRLVHVCPNCEHQISPRAKYCEECGTILTGDAASFNAAVPMRRGTAAWTQLYGLLPAVIALLQRETRVPYRMLTYVFGIDEAQPAGQTAAASEYAPVPAEAATVRSPAPSELARPPRETEPAAPSPEELSVPIAPTLTSEPGRSAPEAERRQLTVMFCDLADSTKLSQQLDPEDLREVVRAYQTTAAEVIHQYEGHIAQYLGDGLLMYFGWPVAHEDDAQRALHTGLGIVEAITTSLNPRLHREKGIQLTVRLGIHTGPVVVGEMGGGGRHENLATGETVNIAARLEGLAASNTVVISHVTARLVRGAFALEDLGLHVLKGVAEPMPVFQVLGSMEARENAEHVAAGVPFLVGRDEERGLLLRRWEQSKEGLGQVVLVGGEAGIGKSRLVEVLRVHIREEGLPRIAFRCSSYHRQSALYPVIVHVERLLAFDRDDPPLRSWPNWSTDCARIACPWRKWCLSLPPCSPYRWIIGILRRH